MLHFFWLHLDLTFRLSSLHPHFPASPHTRSFVSFTIQIKAGRSSCASDVDQLFPLLGR